MTAIFDEGVPLDLLPILRKAGCDVVGFPNKWKGTKNGRLVQLVESEGFTCLLTRTCHTSRTWQADPLRLSFCRHLGLQSSR